VDRLGRVEVRLEHVEGHLERVEDRLENIRDIAGERYRSLEERVEKLEAGPRETR
jgi:archaellum component FlaC